MPVFLKELAMSNYLDLYDYRCRVAAIYGERTQAYLAGDSADTILQHFREARNDLFATHPQSALDEEQRRAFRGLHYFPYNPMLTFLVEVDTDIEATSQHIAMNADEIMTMTTVGRVSFTVENQPAD